MAAASGGYPDLTSPEFWIGVFAVGVVVHISASLIKTGASRGVSWIGKAVSSISAKRRAQATARAAEHEEAMQFLKTSPKDIEYVYRMALLYWIQCVFWNVMGMAGAIISLLMAASSSAHGKEFGGFIAGGCAVFFYLGQQRLADAFKFQRTWWKAERDGAKERIEAALGKKLT